MSRFFVPRDAVQDNIIVIKGDDLNHIKNVLRKKPGDKIVCFDPAGFEYETELVSYGNTQAVLKVIASAQKQTEPAIRIVLAQALPRSSKMDDIVQKATELGASEIIPVITERTVAKGSRTERWNRISKESAEQSGRAIVPAVRDTVSFDELLRTAEGFDLKILPWECEESRTLKSVLSEKSELSSILLLIGPEGGFSPSEASKASEKGFMTVSLGKRILRTQTAGPAAMAMILYEMEMK